MGNAREMWCKLCSEHVETEEWRYTEGYGDDATTIAEYTCPRCGNVLSRSEDPDQERPDGIGHAGYHVDVSAGNREHTPTLMP